MMWHLATLNCLFVLAELIIWITLIAAAATADQVINQPSTASPLKIARHPSTYFDRVKPIFNDFTHYGIHMKMPIGEVVEHAKTAMHFVAAMSFDKWSLEDFQQSSSMSGNDINETAIPADKMWHVSMQRMLRIKSSSLVNKIKSVEDSLDAHAVPAENFIEALTMHHATTAKFTKRSIDFKFDITSAISTFFSGVNSIFHFKAINEVSQAVNNLQVSQTHLQDFTENFARKVSDLIILLRDKEREDTHTLASAFTIFMLLDEAETCLDVVLNAITPLLQGILPTAVVTPANLVELYETVKAAAAEEGHRLAISNPNEILTLQPFTFQRNNSYEMIVSIPIVDPDQQFTTYHLVNLPTLKNKLPTVWDLPNLLYGLRPSLYPQVSEYVTIEMDQVNKICSEFYEMILCNIPTITQPSCISDLYHNMSDHCTTKTLTYVPILQPITQKYLFFFRESTQALIQCQKNFAKVTVQGLIQIEDKANCQIVTSEFSFAFVGSTPMEMFYQFPMKIVDNNIMPATTEPVEDEVDKDIQALFRSIDNFNETKINLKTIPVGPVMNYVTLGVAVFALLLISGLIVIFLLKSKKYLAKESKEEAENAKPVVDCPQSLTPKSAPVSFVI